MKRLQTLCLFLLFAAVLIVTGALQADEINVYGSCGAKPSTLDKLFTNAAKIRQKCIDDVYEAHKLKIEKEIEELANTSEKLNLEIKKVAIKSSVGLVQCSPRNGEPARDPKLIKSCEDLTKLSNAVIDRMHELTGWNDRPRPVANEKTTEQSLNPPCPPNEKLADLRQAATFNRKLFKTWEYCRSLMVDKM